MRPWRRFVILVIVFIAGLVGFSKMTNHEKRDLTKDMEEAVLPVVYLTVGGEPVNELHGYADGMDAASVRDTITPLPDGGTLPVEIDTYGAEIKSLEYEIRSLDTTRLVQDSEAEELTATGDRISADLNIRNLLSDGEEYLLILKITTADRPCYYYTRIIREENSFIDECLAFVKSFHEITMDKDRQSELAAYMEPEADADNTTLQKVSIHNSLSQACWGTLDGHAVTEPVASIKELNDTYNVILLQYIFTSENEDGSASWYNVEEYYRVRKGEKKIYLLSFERTTEEIFDGDTVNIQGNNLNLGIRSADVDYRSNETGTVVCFVQQGELWSYNVTAGMLTRVFSFRGGTKVDARENYGEHDIRIIRADESGSIDFIVYGYMNRGEFEGQVGISVCHYDCMANTVQQSLFIPSSESFQIMKEEIGQAMYITDTGLFYLMMGHQIHCINLETKEDTLFISDITDDNYESSDDGRYLAWTKGEAQDAAELYLTDFESGTTDTIPAGENNRIRPLAFLQSDCVYGIASEQNVSEESSVFAMNRIDIIDSGSPDHPVIKSYDGNGTYVTDARVDDGSIYLSRAIYSNGVYVETDPDIIRSRDMQEEVICAAESVSDSKEREIVLQLPFESGKKTSLLIPKQIVNEESVRLELTGEVTESAYYVYAKGKVLLGTNQIAEAVICADENRGVVIGPSQQYVWKRAKQISADIGVTDMGGSSAEAKALTILLNRAGVRADTDALVGSGMSAYEILKENITEVPVYNLTGCTLEQVLYFAGAGDPVLAMYKGQAVLITGYDEENVQIWHPETGDREKISIKNAAEQFAADGNVFMTAGDY